MTTWIMCGYTDSGWYMVNMFSAVAFTVIAVIFNPSIKNPVILPVVFLVIGCVALLVMLIMRLVSGSALGD